jgi:hypothetical protein
MGNDFYEDTNPGFGIDQLILDELYQITKSLEGVSGRLDKLENRMEVLESKMEGAGEQTARVVRDLNVIHKFQKGYAERLSGIEQMMIDEPLFSNTPPPSAARCISDTPEASDDVK